MMRVEITVQPGRLELDKRLLKQTMRAAGNEVAAAARAMVRGSSGGGRGYFYQGKRYTASAPGQAPVSRSGQLAGGFKVSVYKSGEGFAVRDRVFYAKMLEGGAKGGGGNARGGNIWRAGTRIGSSRRIRGANRMKTSAINRNRVLQPRPFLSQALLERRESLTQRIVTSINSGMKFQRLPAKKKRSA